MVCTPSAGAFFQGVTVGAFVAGVPVNDGVYARGPFDWLRPFPLFTGAGLVIAYALLGATWLVMKTDDALQARMRSLGIQLTWALLAVIVVISLWTPLAHEAIARRWLSWPAVLWFSPVPALVALATFGLLRGLRRQAEIAPFLLALALISLSYSGLGISLWPDDENCSQDKSLTGSNRHGLQHPLCRSTLAASWQADPGFLIDWRNGVKDTSKLSA